MLIEQGIDISKIEKIGIRNKDPNILEGLRKITFDGYMHKGEDILMEIKFGMRASQVDWFVARARAFEKIKGIIPKLWIVAIEIEQDALEKAKEYGIKIITRR